MSQTHEDSILHQDNRKKYSRSRHRRSDKENQSNFKEQNRNPETAISVDFRHRLSIIFFSLILTIFSISVPLFTDFANGLQSQNLYTGLIFSKGALPYTNIFATGGFLYYVLIALAYYLGSTLWLLPLQFLAYYVSGIYLYKTVTHLTGKKEVAAAINLIFFVLNGTLGFGGLYPVQFAFPFILAGIWFLTRYFAGVTRDEMFIFYGLAGTVASLIEARSLIFWVLSLIAVFVYNLINRHFARGFYQVLCIIFGNILILYVAVYFIINLEITSTYIKQVLGYYFGHFALSNQNLLLTILYQVVIIFGSGLLLGLIGFAKQVGSNAQDKAIKTVLMLSLLVTAIYIIASQSYNVFTSLHLLPYGLILTALYLSDVVTQVNSGRSHRRRKSGDSSFQVFSFYLSRSLFLPIVVLSLAFAEPIVMYLYNLKTNNERTVVADYISENTSSNDSIYVFDSTAKIYAKSGRLPVSQFALPDINTAESSNSKKLEDTLLQNSANYIIVRKDKKISDQVSADLSNYYEAVSVDGVSDFIIYHLK
ncbi:hypothetical protein [Streptococcus dentiloxodontae]